MQMQEHQQQASNRMESYKGERLSLISALKGVKDSSVEVTCGKTFCHICQFPEGSVGR